MKNAIKFVRVYNRYGTQYADIVYRSNRVRTEQFENIPKTAADFIANGTAREQYDRTLKRAEIIYTGGVKNV